MASRTIDRRAFLSTGARAGITVCGLCLCSRFPAFAGDDEESQEQPLDPKKLNYCGYTCPKDCRLPYLPFHIILLGLGLCNRAKSRICLFHRRQIFRKRKRPSLNEVQLQFSTDSYSFWIAGINT